MVEHSEVPHQRAQHRYLLRRVARHDLAVLVVEGLSPELYGEGADVVGDEAIHRGLLAIRWCVIRRDHLSGVLEAVGRVEHVEQLGVGVLILLPGIGIWRIHVSGNPIRHCAEFGTMLGPSRDRVAQVPAQDPFERIDLAGLVQVAEQVVERAVLEEHEDHVIHCVRS